ncbi:MAG: hypothetical protein Q8S71_03860 [Hydrogenophaga sp.]|nr:hypothetical protein [Hydrogenophaga sp.]
MGLHDPKHICKDCGHVGQPKDMISGSFAGEVAIWVIAIVIANATSWLFMILPLIYTIYRASSKKAGCELCGSTQIIPLDSPNGKALADISA